MKEGVLINFGAPFFYFIVARISYQQILAIISALACLFITYILNLIWYCDYCFLQSLFSASDVVADGNEEKTSSCTRMVANVSPS